MALKADYKDDVFSGARKYMQVNNADNTKSFLDVTEYSQEGDYFGANQVNEMATEINRLEEDKANKSEIPTALPANGGNADTLDNKHASDFADATHTHTKSQISDMPTSMPANGGNADTVDNFHAWQLQNLNASGSTESTYVKSQFVNTTKGFYLSADNGTGASMVRTVSVRMADTLYGVSSSAPSSPQTNDLWIW